MHATQFPPEQTRLVPQAVPFATLDPVSVHGGVPIAHDRVPVWQTLAGAHDEPAAQTTQLPPLHTMLFPHELPLGASPMTRHSDAPDPHDVRPALHTVP